jgi:hypothetical protein
MLTKREHGTRCILRRTAYNVSQSVFTVAAWR